MYLTRILNWCRIAGILLGCTVFSSSVAGSTEPLKRAEAARFALIVDIGTSSGAKELAAVLGESYGFEVLYLPEGQATLEGIREAMDEIYDRVRPYDQLLVFVDLPVLRDRGLFFVPFRGDPDSPWTLLSGGDVIDWFVAMPTGSAFVVFPSCAPRSSYDYHELEELAYAKRPGTVDVLFACHEAIRSFGDDNHGPLDWGGSRVAEAIAEYLHETALGGPGEMAGSEVAYRLSKELDGFQLTILQLPRLAESGFRFVPSGTIADYQARYREARSLRELRQVIEEFIAVAADDEGVQGGLVACLRRVAIDPQAAAADAKLEPNEILGLREFAVEVLSRTDSLEARDALIDVVDESTDSPLLRAQAVSQLSRLRDLRTKDRRTLRGAIRDLDPGVRESAVRALIISEDHDGGRFFRELAVADPYREVRIAAIQGLSGLKRKSDRNLFISMLEDGDSVIRSEAATALGRLGQWRGSSSALLAVLRQDDDDLVRQTAAYALGSVWVEAQRADIVRGLAEALERGPEAVAAAAAFSLGKIGGEEAEEMLRQVLREDNPDRIAVAAAESLGRLRCEAAIPELERAAFADDSPDLRRAAVTALGSIGTDRAAEILFSKIDDKDPYVRQEARRAVEGLEPQQFLLVDGTQSDSADARRLTYRAMGRNLNVENIDALVEGLNDDSYDARSEAIEALARFSHPDAATKVAQALRHGNLRVRLGASQVLGLMPDEVNDIALENLAIAAEDLHSAVRTEAIKALGKRRDLRSLEILLTATYDDNPDVRRAAVESLIWLADDASQGEVRERLETVARSDWSHEVRQAAIDVLAVRSRTEKKDW